MASHQRAELQCWIEALSEKYTIVFYDNLETIQEEGQEINNRFLLIIDASLLVDMNCINRMSKCIKKIIIVGDVLSPIQQINMIHAGACGCSERFIDKKLMFRAIAAVLKNEIWLERRIIPKMLKSIVDKNFASMNNKKFNHASFDSLLVLTPREIEVIDLIYDGIDNIEIANKLNISVRTVKAHLSAIYRKLKVQDRFQLIVYLKDLHVNRLTTM
ncbi:hypothetical protein AU255_03895 [Methyloprofundus sedimenti]|uniref:HTH luxR-type domain-containing protein n=2 Tax=Methyloprofundus sedimenti TaxID=1420851 RepID=A0A1V8M637_9GAMM|nr:hypothetical protein AU255_03895 [Methyloprofundus sedimenti]